MGKTYLDLKQEAEKLMAEAEGLRQKETDQVIEEIKQKMRAYGITADDLGPRRLRVKGRAGSTAAKYKGPNGELWSGGRGRKPAWVVQALKEGKKIEDFAV